MTHAFQGAVGAISLSAPDDRAAAPWWPVFRDLRDAKGAFGLKARHLTTLAALLSFLKPGGPMVVFAANRSILDRLNGLCERSLQRHVADLAAAGLLQRQDSPNGKRFRVTGTDSALIYGFDLSPLMAQADRIAHLADDTRTALREARLWRQRLLDRLAALAGELDAETEHSIRVQLRRPRPAAVWQDLLERLPRPPASAQLSTNLSASDRQIVGHHQTSEEDVSFASDLPHPDPLPSDRSGLLRKLRAACPDVAQWLDGGLTSWDGIHAQIRRLAGWIGITDPIYAEAEQRCGADAAALTLCGIAQLGTRVRTPAAYFRSLTTGRRAAGFNPVMLLDRLARGGDVIHG